MDNFFLQYGKSALAPRGWAEYVSTIKPLYGRIDVKTKLVDTLQDLQARWRNRLTDLQLCEWSDIQGDKFGYAWNCPPCCVSTTPWMQPCKLRICPFCHARAVANIFTNTYKQLDGEQLLSFRVLHGHKPKCPDRIFVDFDTDLLPYFEQIVLPRHAAAKKRFRPKYLRRSLGGWYWYTFAPKIFKNSAADDAVGLWYTQHSCVALMPDDWKLPGTLQQHAIVCKDAKIYDFAWAIGRAFLYRNAWLQAQPMVVAQMLNHIKGKRFRTGFGCFRSCRRS
jgi:hypothetical protein